MIIEVVLLSLLILAGSLAVLRRALTSRRADRHLVCANCHHDLHGIPWQTPVCPECGESLGHPDNLRVGNRQVRPVMAWVSGVVAAGAVLTILVVVGIGVRQMNWQQTKPVWLLRYEAVSGGETTSLAAMKEVVRRVDRQDASVLILEPLRETVLDRHQRKGITFEHEHAWIIERLHDEGCLSSEQWRAYAKNYLNMSVVANPNGSVTLVAETRGGIKPAFLLGWKLTAGTLPDAKNVAKTIYESDVGPTVMRSLFPITPQAAGTKVKIPLTFPSYISSSLPPTHTATLELRVSPFNDPDTVLASQAVSIVIQQPSTDVSPGSSAGHIEQK